MSSKQRKFVRQMEYFLCFCEKGYFINKSKNPNVSARRFFHRAFNEDRDDYENEGFKVVRELGEENFLVRYTLEMPEWCECRAHWVSITPEQYKELLPQVEKMRAERTPVIKPLTKRQKEELAAKGEYMWKKNG